MNDQERALADWFSNIESEENKIPEMSKRLPISQNYYAFHQNVDLHPTAESWSGNLKRVKIKNET